MGGRKISDEKIRQVRKLLKTAESIHEAARQAGVSYFTAYQIKQMDNPAPRPEPKRPRYFQNDRCWAVGRYL